MKSAVFTIIGQNVHAKLDTFKIWKKDAYSMTKDVRMIEIVHRRPHASKEIAVIRAM
jgi:hypothetical protein